jgi:hypothetical protein
MAKITLAAPRPFTGNAPYGNLSVQSFRLKTSATGAPIGADSTAALAAGDVVDLGGLQSGLRLEDAQTAVKTALTGNAQLGFAYEDGVDDPSAPQDAAYFGAAVTLTAIAKVKANGTKLVTLPKNARLILTLSATQVGAGEIEVLVYGEQAGLF